MISISIPPPPPPLWNCQIICFCHVEIFRYTASGNLDPSPHPWENFLDPRMPNTVFQNLFFKIITSLANIFSNLFSPREIIGFFLFQYRFSFYLCDNFLNVTECQIFLQVLHKRVNLQTQFLKYEPCWHDIQ